MIERLFPSSFDNNYQGHRLALWGFYFLTALTVWRSQHHLFAQDGGAQSIAHIPLDTFSEPAATTVISVFSLWGLSQLIIAVLYLLACLRYRSMIPLLYLLAALEYFIRFAYVGQFKPIVTTGTAPGEIINIPFTIIFLVMFILSMRPNCSPKSAS